MCFSAEADLVAGAVVTVVGVDALRPARRPGERALGALPVLLGAHLLVEVLVWQGLTGDVDASVGRQAMWLYLVFALLVLPVLGGPVRVEMGGQPPRLPAGPGSGSGAARSPPCGAPGPRSRASPSPPTCAGSTASPRCKSRPSSRTLGAGP